MSIKVGEVGKLFRYATGYDMSGSNVLTLKFTSPSGASASYTSGVTAPASIVTDPDLGSIAASTYMQYTTDGTEFTEAGLWTVCGTYQDATPKLFHGDDATFTVGEAC